MRRLSGPDGTNRRRMFTSMLLCGLATLAASAPLAWAGTVHAGDRPPPHIDDRRLARAFGNDAPWYRDNIPYFESSDSSIDAVYYYRWSVFRAHQRDLGTSGYITTEFLDDVGWQLEPYASLNDASGFHINEGRWLRDRRYAGDYIDFMYDRGNDRHFSEAIADAAYARFLVDGDRTDALRNLASMERVYDAWQDRFDSAKGLYFIEPIADATEYTISSIDASGGRDGFFGGTAFRPSMNSYMFANARAISRLAAMAGDEAKSTDFARRADRLRDGMRDALWSDTLGHYVDRYQVTNEFVKYWQPIRGRELVGYLPWTYGIAPDDPLHAAAWRHLINPAGFAGPFGMRTVEPDYQFYMKQYRYEGSERECQWNGPIWPFQTTQVLIGLANFLRDYHQTTVSRTDYVRLLRQYARLHYRNGRLDIEEDYDPATGGAIVGLPRSHHYFHSGFDDLVISGLVGLRPRADDVLEVDPLVPRGAGTEEPLWFLLQDVPYHGRLVTILYDRDGDHYHLGGGLRVYVDGVLTGSSPTASRLIMPIDRKPAVSRATRIDRAVELVPGAFPKPSASSGPPDRIHDGVDGRIMFFPEVNHGWDSAAGEIAPWFAIDFGRPTVIGSAELAFFEDAHHAAPAAVILEGHVGGLWRTLVRRSRSAVGNGVTDLAWKPVSADRVRIRLTLSSGKPVRMAELKVF